MRMTLKHDVKVIPRRGRLMALLMQFDDLHKIRAPVGICEGLDLGLYDEMIEVQLRNIDYCIMKSRCHPM